MNIPEHKIRQIRIACHSFKGPKSYYDVRAQLALETFYLFHTLTTHIIQHFGMKDVMSLTLRSCAIFPSWRRKHGKHLHLSITFHLLGYFVSYSWTAFVISDKLCILIAPCKFKKTNLCDNHKESCFIFYHRYQFVPSRCSRIWPQSWFGPLWPNRRAYGSILSGICPKLPTSFRWCRRDSISLW